MNDRIWFQCVGPVRRASYMARARRPRATSVQAIRWGPRCPTSSHHCCQFVVRTGHSHSTGITRPRSPHLGSVKPMSAASTVVKNRSWMRYW